MSSSTTTPPRLMRPAETSAEATDTMTLSQAYFDGDWLRLSVVLEDQDGSLAAFDEIAPIHPEQRADPAAWPDDREGYGDLVLADGRLLGNEGYPAFAKQDENTWVLVLNYPVFLESDPTALAGQELTLVLRDLVAYNKVNLVHDVDEYGRGASQWEMENETDLPGVYTMTFTVPAAGEAGCAHRVGGRRGERRHGRRTARNPGRDPPDRHRAEHPARRRRGKHPFKLLRLRADPARRHAAQA